MEPMPHHHQQQQQQQRSLRQKYHCQGQSPLVTRLLVAACWVYFYAVYLAVPGRCQTAVDVCANSTCANGSTCLADTTVIRGYVCNCTDTNFTGENCDKRVNQNCSSGLCLNGGTCTDNTTAQNVSTFRCVCPGGYKGPLCGLKVNYCANLPCGQGTCQSNTATQNYTCTCPAGFTGVNCETDINDCVGVTCSNHGTCQDRRNDYYCNCTEGWEGTLCERDVDECARNVCMHGSCQNLTGGFSCNCYNTGFSGKHCETEINECNLGFCVHGNCNDTEGSFICACNLGFRGPNCSQAICSDNQCLSNSTCQIVGGGSDWKCNCLQHYAGRQCEHKGPCLTYPCNPTNTARCEQDPYFFNSTNSTMTNRTCVCNPGWQGDDCSTDIDECTSRRNNCTNGATCQNTQGSYTCACVPGYTGRNCEHDIKECDSSPCEHGGTCADGINSFTCDCNNTGYNGPTCKTDVDECAENPEICYNGNCSNTEGNYLCDCGDQYLGRNCEKSNPCSTGPCQNGGSCNHTLDGSDYVPVCSCVGGYGGNRCQMSPQTNELNIMYIIGPIIAVVLLAIIIGVIIFVMIARNKRATRGAYSPSQQETAGSRVELGNVLKKPPEERLI